MTKYDVVRPFLSGAAVVGLSVAALLSTISFSVESGAQELTTLPSGQPVEDHAAVADIDPAPMPATYTAAQAESGKKEFGHECVECHGKDLRGGLLGGPPLRGVSFEQKYGKGAPAGVLFEVMSGTMPPNAPGSYSPAVYASLMAYILKTNGFKAGAELPSDIDALYNLSIEK